VRLLREGAEKLGEMGIGAKEAAESTEKFAIAQKARIRATRTIHYVDEEWANILIDLINSFVADGVDLMHHLKRLSKIENNPNGYYTQQYRQLSAAYRQAMHNVHGGKARGRSRKKGEGPVPLIRAFPGVKAAT
jgi:hypothetical protein